MQSFLEVFSSWIHEQRLGKFFESFKLKIQSKTIFFRGVKSLTNLRKICVIYIGTFSIEKITVYYFWRKVKSKNLFQ